MSEKPSKSDRTRGVILDVAQRLFSERGYDGTTIREIATEANIDPALVIRYFGSKEELFVRTAAIELALPALDELDQSSLGEVVVRHFLGVWEGPGANRGMAVLLRSAASNELSAIKLREVFATQVTPLVERVGPRSTTTLRSALIAGQLLGLALCRYVLKLPPLNETPAEDLVKQVGPTILRYMLLKQETAKAHPPPSTDQVCFGFLSTQDRKM
jgi:AcrR family transcriptional regulator